MKRLFLSIISLLFVASLASAQVCLPPPPIVEGVSVVPNSNGNITITWHENPSNTCVTTGYEIYKYNYTTHIFDLLFVAPAGTTSYIDISAGGNVRSQIYRMTTVAGTSGTEHSENHHSVYLRPVLQYGPCEMTATISWTPYKISYRDLFEERLSDRDFNDSVKYQIVGYQTPAAMTFNPASAMPLSEIMRDTTTEISLEVGQNYKYCVMAILPNGSKVYSNVADAKIDGSSVPIAPKYINIDSLVSYDTHNHLHFVIDSITTMTKFQIERTDTLGMPFEIIHTFSDKTLSTFDDTNCDVDKEYFYRITAFNDIPYCNTIPARISDTINSIILSPVYQDPNAMVTWNKYHLDSVYYLYRQQTFRSIESTNQYLDTDVQTELQNNVYDICYQVYAYERNTMFVSISREYCLALERTVTMPNAIDPTSNITNNIETGRLRNEFGPIIGGNSLGYAYNMIIFDRWNNVIFQTEKKMNEILSANHFWHGESKNGNFLTEDTYLYYIKVTFKDFNTVFEQKGTVNIIYK